MWFSKLNDRGKTAGFGPCFHLPGQPILGAGFLSHSQMNQPTSLLNSIVGEWGSSKSGLIPPKKPRGDVFAGYVRQVIVLSMGFGNPEKPWPGVYEPLLQSRVSLVRYASWV